MRLSTILLLGIFLIPQFGYALGGSTCAQATVVGALPYTDSGQLESGYDPNCPGEPVNDLFYEFTAPSTGTFRFDMCGSNNCCFQQMRLWTDGTCCSGASVTVDSGCVDAYPQYDLVVTSGQVVYIEVGKSGIEWGVAPLYQFNVTAITPDSAATCSSAIDVVTLPYADSKQLQPGLNDDCPGDPANDIFYRFAAPYSGLFTFDMCGSDSCCDHQMRIWTGGMCCSGDSVAIDSGCPDGKPQYQMVMSLGQVAYIEVGKSGGVWPDPPFYEFQITGSSQAGTTCDSATLIGTLPYVDSGQLQQGINDDCPGGPVNDRFYHFVAPHEGTYRLDMCGSDSCCDFQMRISFWQCCDPTPVIVDSGCADGKPQYDLYMNESYLIFVEIGKTGEGLLNPPFYEFRVTDITPTGSSCSDPIIVDTYPYYASYQDSTDSPGSPECEGAPFFDLFYKFTAPVSERYRFSLCGSSDNVNAMRIWLDSTCCSGNSILILNSPCPQVDERTFSPTHEMAMLEGESVYIEAGKYVDYDPTPEEISLVVSLGSPGQCEIARAVGALPYETGTWSEPDSNDDCQGSPYNDVFYVFTAPHAGVFSFDLEGSVRRAWRSPWMRIWTDGTCCSGASVEGWYDETIYSWYDLEMSADQTVYLELGLLSNPISDSQLIALNVRELCLSIPESLVIQPSGADIVLTWSVSWLCTGSYNYNIYRSSTADVQPIPANWIATTAYTTYTDIGVLLTPDILNFYVVTTE